MKPELWSYDPDTLELVLQLPREDGRTDCKTWPIAMLRRLGWTITAEQCERQLPITHYLTGIL